LESIYNGKSSLKQFDLSGFHFCWDVSENEDTFSYAHQEGASGMIKFLAGSCLSELGIVLKGP
jgi:hypothetical protein